MVLLRLFQRMLLRNRKLGRQCACRLRCRLRLGTRVFQMKHNVGSGCRRRMCIAKARCTRVLFLSRNLDSSSLQLSIQDFSSYLTLHVKSVLTYIRLCRVPLVGLVSNRAESHAETPCRWLQTRTSSSLITFKNVTRKFLNCPKDYKGNW